MTHCLDVTSVQHIVLFNRNVPIVHESSIFYLQRCAGRVVLTGTRFTHVISHVIIVWHWCSPTCIKIIWFVGRHLMDTSQSGHLGHGLRHGKFHRNSTVTKSQTHLGNDRTHIPMLSPVTPWYCDRTTNKLVGHEILPCVQVPISVL